MSEVLAEVRVAVVPDASTFGALLAAEIAAASRTIPPVVVPVQIAGATQTAALSQAVAQSQQLATVQATVGATATATARATKGLTDEQRLQNRAVRALAISQEDVLNVVDSVGRAQVTATRSAAALTAARRAEAAITRQTSAADAQAIVTTLRLAEAQQLEAATALQAATAQQRHATSLAGVSRGAGSAGLTLLGVRGATLAANGAFLAGAAAVATFSKSLELATSFQQEMAVFGVTTEATGQQMEQASVAAREFGRDITLPGVNATDAAEAMTEFARAGLSVTDSIAATRGGLQLATAAQLSNADAVELSAGALNAFGLAGNQAVRVADLLANAANLAQGGIEEMGLALRQSAGVARQVGVSLEDTVALLTLLARNGLQGSDAGTALRTSLIRLINPTKEARNILEDLNIQLRDQRGNIRPEVFAEFAASQRNLSRAQQDANAAIVFGQDAIRALAILGREGQKGIDSVTEGLQKQGTAAEVAAARNVGLGGAAENLKNQFASLGQDIGETADGPLTDFLNFTADGIKNINDFNAFLNSLGETADDTSDAFAKLAAEAGKINAAVAARGGRAGEGLLEEQERLNKALEESLGPGVEATKMIEDYRVALDLAADASAGLTSRIDESVDRFARQPVPALPKGPTPIGPTARLDSALEIAQAEGDFDEVERLQREALARAKRAFENSKGNVEQRTALFQAMRSAEADLISTQARISEDAASKSKQAAADAKRARDDADQAFIDQVTGRLARISNQELVAQATKGLADDIRVATTRRQVLRDSIAETRKTVQDARARKQELASLTRDLIQTQLEIADLTRQQAEAVAKANQEQIAARADLLADLTEIQALRGNEPGQARGLQAEIRFWRTVALNAEKGSEAQREAILQVERKRAELRDLLEEAEGGPDSTTLAQFLTQNNALFSQIASNLGTVGVDPLSGFDFSQSVVASLTRMQEAARGQAGAARAGQKPPLDPQMERLIAALDRNTEATNGNTNSGSAGFSMTRYEKVTGQRAAAMGRFWESANARRLEDDRASGGI